MVTPAKIPCALALVLPGLTLACQGDDTAASGDASASSGASSSSASASATATTTGESSSGSGSASASTSTSASTGASTATSSSSSAGETDDLKYDVAGHADIAVGNDECGCGNSDFSYIWVANSDEGTVSKINTRTLVEEGRYRTRETPGSPSRTSVSIDGRAVAVANRFGGLIKIWARPEDCEDTNGIPGIQTSTGKNDVLPWGQDECIAWFQPFDGYTVQRPVAFTSGTLNEVTCEYDDQEIWTIAGKGGDSPGTCGAQGVDIYLLDAATGATKKMLHLEEAEVNCAGSLLGAYGAAVDSKNDLWFHMWGFLQVYHVTYDTMQHESVGSGGYGITTDIKGRVWTGDYPKRYDPATKLWETHMGDLPGAGGSGVAQDLEGRIWTATQGGVGWVDMDTLIVGGKVLLPDPGIYRGISVDIDGYIWAIPLGGTKAYRIDPDTLEYEFYDGLNGPYTYSDMAGGQLNQVTCSIPAG